ncbi:MAG TPA: glycosyltransferase family 4 protein [Rhizobiaceae bacterium]|nr:glycosyltransferase family 4 protein [Rhizobiaceae bacterium]
MSKEPLRIVHCFRSPVGGIFRHVRDLVAAQSAAGHSVGIVCDSSTGGAFEEALFEAMRPQLALGLTRIPMDRAITPRDLGALWRAFGEIRKLQPHVLHSHGAKGGAYARMIGSALRVSGSRVARLYCPHGGSIHYDAGSLKGRVFFALERMLERMTDRLVFVSRYEAQGYAAKVGTPRRPQTIVYNGLSPHEFEPVPAEPDASDFLYIGMMRDLKGCDVFLDAIAHLRKQTGRDITANFVGDGPDKQAYIQRIAKLGLSQAVTVHDPMPARQAFAKAKVVVVPSRAESMPYIVLEAVAAARPLVATRVGGIPEIFEGSDRTLVEPGNVETLAAAMIEALDDPRRDAKAAEASTALQKRFSVETMANAVETAYRDSL